MRFAKIGLLLCCLAVAAVAGLYLGLGRRPLSSLIHHGGTVFLSVAKDDDRLSPSMRRVLAGAAGTPTSGDCRWQETQPGFAVGELPVLVDGTEVDRLLVAKADPSRFRVIARNDPSGSTTVDRWRHDLAAVLVVNGSYYAASGLPDTPFVADGRRLGPIPTMPGKAPSSSPTRRRRSKTWRTRTGTTFSRRRVTGSSPIRCSSRTESRAP